MQQEKLQQFLGKLIDEIYHHRNKVVSVQYRKALDWVIKKIDELNN